MSSRVVVVSPVRNEEAHIRAVAGAMAAQTRPPDLWLVADDGSTDGTPAVLRELEQEIGFMRVAEVPPLEHDQTPDRLAVAAEARAFNWALGQVAGDGYAFVGKLDGDIVLDPRHFERLLAEFDRDPRLGIAGSFLEHEQHGGGRRLGQMPDYHVQGAVKLYRRRCFEEIGGMRECLGWDTLDEVHARMTGWRTRSFRDLRGVHLRPSGSVGGALRGRARHGECAWILAYPLPLVLARGARLAVERPPLVAGAAYVYGWLRAALRRRGRPDDAELMRFSRAEQRRRLRAELGRRVRPRARA